MQLPAPMLSIGRRGLSLYREHVRSVFYSRSITSQDGYYEVTPQYPNAAPFTLWLPDLRSSYRQASYQGNLEPPVGERLLAEVGPEDTFWDIGANRGYFSFVVADRIDSIVAFDADSAALRALRKSLAANDFDNIRVVEGIVGEDVDLDDYEPPDIALIDTEGWEYEILKSAPETLKSTPTLIIEIHKHEGVTDSGSPLPPEINPKGVREILHENGYTIETINQDSAGREHILAKSK